MQHIHVTRWGNSLGFRIPRGIAESMHIEAGDTLELTPSGDGLLVKKAEPPGKHYALADVLDSFATAEQCPAEDFGRPQGEEVW